MYPANLLASALIVSQRLCSNLRVFSGYASHFFIVLAHNPNPESLLLLPRVYNWVTTNFQPWLHKKHIFLWWEDAQFSVIRYDLASSTSWHWSSLPSFWLSFITIGSSVSTVVENDWFWAGHVGDNDGIGNGTTPWFCVVVHQPWKYRYKCADGCSLGFHPPWKPCIGTPPPKPVMSSSALELLGFILQ
jgi:hypothetical protein